MDRLTSHTPPEINLLANWPTAAVVAFWASGTGVESTAALIRACGLNGGGNRARTACQTRHTVLSLAAVGDSSQCVAATACGEVPVRLTEKYILIEIGSFSLRSCNVDCCILVEFIEKPNAILSTLV